METTQQYLIFCNLKSAKGRKQRKKKARAGDAWYGSWEVQGMGAGRHERNGRYGSREERLKLGSGIRAEALPPSPGLDGRT